MDKRKTGGREKGGAVKSSDLVVNDIRLVNIDRTMKDIGKWRRALINAESIYYPNRSLLLDLYEDVRLDAHVTGIINKRMDAVLNKAIRFIKDDEEVEGMEPFLESAVFRDILTHILEVKMYGVSGMEFTPGTEVNYEPIPRKHIRPETGVIVLDQSAQEGIAYKDLSNVWVIGKKRDFGLLLQCSPYALYKKGNYGDWAQYVEIFGQPVRIMKYDANDLKTKNELKKAVDDAGSSLALMIPKQVEFSLLDGKTSNGDGQLQQRLKDSLNDEMSILILGNTETTSSSNGGSNAKAKEHGKQQLQVTKSDMAFALTQLNSPKFLSILKSYSLPVDGGKFQFEKDTDLTELTQKINIDIQVATMVPIEDDYFYETYAVPKPKNYEAMRKAMDEKLDRQNAGQQSLKPITEEGAVKDTGQKKAKDKPAEKVKLKGVDKLKLWLADFFVQALKS